jgi:hypothetical protein
MCFIDSTEAFDTIRHNEVINILLKLHVGCKNLRIIKNIYEMLIRSLEGMSEVIIGGYNMNHIKNVTGMSDLRLPKKLL